MLKFIPQRVAAADRIGASMFGGKEPDLLYHLPHGARREAHPQRAGTGHPGPSAVIETI